MDEPAQSVLDGTAIEPPPTERLVVEAPVTEDPAVAAARWAATLPPPPFVHPESDGSARRFAPLSPRVAILIGAAIVFAFVLAMAADSVRPFIIGLLFVYLLDPPVRWLVRLRVPRLLAILIVYAHPPIFLFLAFSAYALSGPVRRLWLRKREPDPPRVLTDTPRRADAGGHHA